jgi:hypothetical protein
MFDVFKSLYSFRFIHKLALNSAYMFDVAACLMWQHVGCGSMLDVAAWRVSHRALRVSCQTLHTLRFHVDRHITRPDRDKLIYGHQLRILLILTIRVGSIVLPVGMLHWWNRASPPGLHRHPLPWRQTHVHHWTHDVRFTSNVHTISGYIWE